MAYWISVFCFFCSSPVLVISLSIFLSRFEEEREAIALFYSPSACISEKCLAEPTFVGGWFIFSFTFGLYAIFQRRYGETWIISCQSNSSNKFHTILSTSSKKLVLCDAWKINEDGTILFSKRLSAKAGLGIGEWNEGKDGNAWSQGESNMITRNQGGKGENWGWEWGKSGWDSSYRSEIYE